MSSRGTRTAALAAVTFRRSRKLKVARLDQALEFTCGIDKVNSHSSLFSSCEELALEGIGVILSVKIRSVFAGKRRGIGRFDRHENFAAGFLVRPVDRHGVKELKVRIGTDPMNWFYESHIERNRLVDELPRRGEEVLRCVFGFRPERGGGCEQDEDRGDEGNLHRG